MSGHTLGLEDLRDCIASTAPVELEGMRLLKERPHFLSASHQIPREQLVEAVTEIIAYTDQCREAVRKLAHVGPIPLMAVSVLEFGV